jgi:hypothetical protein
MGGAAGGGKSFALLLEPLKHIGNGGFDAVYFRRTNVQVMKPGGLWDEAVKLYPLKDGQPRTYERSWTFPSGASITFGHLEYDKTVMDWHGSQLCLECFDELTNFTAYQFWYLLSRNRSMCGVKPYIRATCNPDADSWVADLISWWIDQETGYAIPSRAGVLRWFVRVGDKLIWADSPDDLRGYTMLSGEPIPPKSLTFIPSKLSDNVALMNADPAYQANLLALPPVERERLLMGNWKIKHRGRAFFDIRSFLVEGQPVDPPVKCDDVWAIIDSATKTGTRNDGSAVLFIARTLAGAYPHRVAILDYDLTQIEGSLLEDWLPSIESIGEDWARKVGARRGYCGAFIEDAASGQILLQQGRRRGLRVFPIPGDLTSKGKDERALGVSGDIYTGKVKITRHAWDKTVVFKGVSKNHLVAQIEDFEIADPNAAKRADDVFDCVTYGTALALETGRIE